MQPLLPSLILIGFTSVFAWQDQFEKKQVSANLCYLMALVSAAFGLSTNSANVLFAAFVFIILSLLAKKTESGKETKFGLADAFVLSSVCSLTGPTGMIASFLIGCVSATFYSVLQLKKPSIEKLRKIEVPFLPHLLVGIVLMVLLW